MHVTDDFLDANPNIIFVFGDNLKRTGHGGAAALRDHKNAYGFITKKSPDNRDSSFYRPDEYAEVYADEIIKLKDMIRVSPGKIWYISKLGAGLANKYFIFEEIIQKYIKADLAGFPGVIFLW